MANQLCVQCRINPAPDVGVWCDKCTTDLGWWKSSRAKRKRINNKLNRYYKTYLPVIEVSRVCLNCREEFICNQIGDRIPKTYCSVKCRMKFNTKKKSLLTLAARR